MLFFDFGNVYGCSVHLLLFRDEIGIGILEHTFITSIQNKAELYLSGTPCCLPQGTGDDNSSIVYITPLNTC